MRADDFLLGQRVVSYIVEYLATCLALPFRYTTSTCDNQNVSRHCHIALGSQNHHVDQAGMSLVIKDEILLGEYFYESWNLRNAGKDHLTYSCSSSLAKYWFSSVLSGNEMLSHSIATL